MKHLFVGALVLSAASLMAQKQTMPPYQPPPYSTPPTFPQDQGTTPSEATPQQGQPMTSVEIEDQIQKKLDKDPGLINTSVSAKVDDKTVTLTGNVDNEQQHDLALRIAQSYAGERKIVDRVQVRGMTQQ
jgi:osmotically-inducible protein OsmY